MTIANGGIRLGICGNLAIARDQKDAVKSQLLLDPGAIKLIADKLKTEHFSLMAHQAIYDCALYLHKKGKNNELLHFYL